MVASGWKLVKVIIYYNEITHEMHDIYFQFIIDPILKTQIDYG